MSVIKSFRDLEVYRIALKEARRIFRITCDFPAVERYALTDQIRRSSRAVNALVAESWARGIYKASFIHKTSEALGEAMETQAWLDHAVTCGYVTQSDYEELDAAWQRIGGMLNRMIQRADDFCKQTAK